MTVITKKYENIPIIKKEILRYAGCKGEVTSDITELMESCINEAKDSIAYTLCYCELEVHILGDVCDFGVMSVTSADLSKSLSGCKKVILFTATLGVEIDRLIKKYSKISPSRAVMIQAVGTAQIEALCDTFCREIGFPRRFSPGYGDLSIDIQTKIFDILNCAKNIGVTLTDSLLMSPSKSVTAFAFSKEPVKNKCKICDKTNCSYRGAL